MPRLKVNMLTTRRLRPLCLLINLIVITSIGCTQASDVKTEGEAKPGGPAVPLNIQLPPAAPPTTQSTELTTDPLNDLLIISTLDGRLTALDRITGGLRWVSKDNKPMIQVPLQQPKSTSQQNENTDQQQRLPKAPYFLPDPKTGSLYMMGKQNSLRKLPFTIPQLVSMAPCKNSEGLMYTGRKLDSWVLLNPYTGETGEAGEDVESCPASDSSDFCEEAQQPFLYKNKKTILIGKTEYSLIMKDGPRKWNVTYHHYSSNDMTQQSLQDYDLVHFTSPSEGHVLTYERSSGKLLWEHTLVSPVIGLYSIEPEATNLLSVPFNPIASDTLERLRSGGDNSNQKALNPTTYVGECAYGLYAVPNTLADEKVLVIGDTTKLPPLLAGPDGESKESGSSPNSNENDYLLLGYYQSDGTEANTQQQIGAEEKIVQFNSSGIIDDKTILQVDKNQSLDVPPKPTQDAGTQTKQHHQQKRQAPEKTIVQFPPLPLQQDGSNRSAEPRKKIGKEVKIVFTTAVISIAVTSSIMGIIFIAYRRHKNKQLEMTQKMLSSSDSGGFLNASGGSGSSSGSRLISVPLPDGTQDMSIGKITFNPSQVLGKGCEGTFVFRGKFEERDVAVKRILPECFQFADREVDLLKESDQHGNVIRYFCTETDGQFRYIALELCVATMSDWVEGRYVNENIDGVELLRQGTEGLNYLHSLRIVHRDVKPANVLLSEDGNGRVKTLISDFGLCKKIQSGRMSYSRRSGGVPGTDGWIAPEVIGHSQATRMTYAVDIFSLGCVYFYVLSNGHHPFGDDMFRRQSNILSGEFDLSKILTDTCGICELIKLMISMDPEERPPLHAILQHPVFWSNEKILNFFLDVSDRIEKETEDGFPLLRRFEENGNDVVRNDWRDHICNHVALDLRKYRTYKGASVRDLLRALRNKKNHYRELDKEAQESLGEIPNQFVYYWVSRFPNLLDYTWKMFEALKGESVFSRYYDKSFNFSDYSGDDVYGDNSFSSGGDKENILQGNNASPLGKDFWKSKNQAKYNKWRGRGRGGGGNNGSPRRYPPQQPPKPDELSASTDNYWRRSSSKSPARMGN